MMPDPTNAKLLRTLHEKRVDGHVMALSNYEVGRLRLYGVTLDGTLQFLGTRREARDYYGTWRSEARAPAAGPCEAAGGGEA